MKNCLLLLLCCVLLPLAAGAQQFRKDQQAQERTIKNAYKNKKVTELEYEKLMREQEVIRAAIEKAEADGVWTPKEKNAVHGKLERAARRLKRYRTNSEVF